MTILLATLWMSSTHYTSGIEARHLCTCLVNSSTVLFVEREWDVLRVYVRGTIVDLAKQEQGEYYLSVRDLLNSLGSVSYLGTERDYCGLK